MSFFKLWNENLSIFNRSMNITFVGEVAGKFLLTASQRPTDERIELSAREIFYLENWKQ